MRWGESDGSCLLLLEPIRRGLPDGEYQWWLMIASGQASADRGFVWTLRAEVVAGLLENGDALRSSTQVNGADQCS